MLALCAEVIVYIRAHIHRDARPLELLVHALEEDVEILVVHLTSRRVHLALRCCSLHEDLLGIRHVHVNHAPKLLTERVGSHRAHVKTVRDLVSDVQLHRASANAVGICVRDGEDLVARALTNTLYTTVIVHEKSTILLRKICRRRVDQLKHEAVARALANFLREHAREVRRDIAELLRPHFLIEGDGVLMSFMVRTVNGHIALHNARTTDRWQRVKGRGHLLSADAIGHGRGGGGVVGQCPGAVRAVRAPLVVDADIVRRGRCEVLIRRVLHNVALNGSTAICGGRVNDEG